MYGRPAYAGIFRVCRDSRAPAKLYDESNSDWAPSLELGHTKTTRSLTQKSTVRYHNAAKRRKHAADINTTKILLELSTTTVALAEYLLDKKTYICGTVRAGRKHLCKEVVKANLKKGEMKATENRKGVKFYKWKDKRDVLTLSTVPEQGSDLVPSGKKNRKGEEILKPESVIGYNKAKKVLMLLTS
ncbi:hypothetical protein Pcinc_006303 [Petrolisthes cinctipes]|uniref:PiggyBac transposable element-derived protein domain-containing protein n=1 Tax=Petrolisthes cinctipes TaxID=88211 RepID=A0AAE1GAY8_PETCI|nr:hypothetical protein Pcinc_006303 [Petrolisthes cinctipes]